MLLSVSKAARLIGVSISTLRRWEDEGKLYPTSRTLGNHRRYSAEMISEVFEFEQNQNESLKNICYARVSSHDQKKDLKRQVTCLRKYCKERNIKSEIIEDLGSGLNFRKKGFKKVINEICQHKVNKIILTHRDRLVRFGFPLFQQICKFFNVQIQVLFEDKEKTFEQELVADVIEIMTVCTARIYGKRSHKHAKAG